MNRACPCRPDLNGCWSRKENTHTCTHQMYYVCAQCRHRHHHYQWLPLDGVLVANCRGRIYTFPGGGGDLRRREYILTHSVGTGRRAISRRMFLAAITMAMAFESEYVAYVVDGFRLQYPYPFLYAYMVLQYGHEMITDGHGTTVKLTHWAFTLGGFRLLIM